MYIILSPYPLSFHLNISVSGWGRMLHIGSVSGGAIAAACGSQFKYYVPVLWPMLGKHYLSFHITLVIDKRLTTPIQSYPDCNNTEPSWKSAGGIHCQVNQVKISEIRCSQGLETAQLSTSFFSLVLKAR